MSILFYKPTDWVSLYDHKSMSHICNYITCLTILKSIFMTRVARTRSESADGLTCDCQDGVADFFIIASLYIGLRRHVIWHARVSPAFLHIFQIIRIHDAEPFTNT